MTRRIAIIGAGLAGLVLARVLHINGVSATVYEAEIDETARPQGGLLDLSNDHGQAALRIAGLHKDFQTLTRPGEDAKRVVDKTGRVLLDVPPNQGTSRPEIDRGDLRTLLLRSIPRATVAWGCKVRRIESMEGGGHRLLFDGRYQSFCDVLVGADGAWSKVRPLLSGAKPLYTGVSFIENQLFNVAANQKLCAGALGIGTIMAVAPGQAVLAHRHADGKMHTYAALKRPEHWFEQASALDSECRLARLSAEFDGWAPYLVALVTQSDSTPVLRAIHALPIGHSWGRTRGVTLIGDAAHLMSPFSGEGANLALLDGAELGLALAARPDCADEAIEAFETSLFRRSAAAAARAATNLNLFFGPTAPESVVALFRR